MESKELVHRYQRDFIYQDLGGRKANSRGVCGYSASGASSGTSYSLQRKRLIISEYPSYSSPSSTRNERF